MLCTTEGIVLSYINFKESSIITQIFTKDLGVKSYIVNSVRSNKNSRIALFQPLSIINLVVYNKFNVQLNRIVEVKCSEPFLDIRSNPGKIFITFFLSEILLKTIKEETENKELFNFIKTSILLLDRTQSNYNNFHLIFLAKLSQHLGFYTSSSQELLSYCSEKNFTQEERRVLEEILTFSFESKIIVSTMTRKKILKTLLQFYYFNIDSMPVINSAKIIEEVLN